MGVSLLCVQLVVAVVTTIMKVPHLVVVVKVRVRFVTPIRLENPDLTDADVAAIVATGSEGRTVIVWGKAGPQFANDLGTFILGPMDQIPNEIKDFIITDEDIVYLVPTEWTVAHLCKRLGMFPSVTQAHKNGKNFAFPNGFSQYTLKVGHVKGVVTIFKVGKDE